MTTISVDFGSVSDAIAQLKSTIAALSNHHEEMKQGLGPTMESWLGDNGSAFQDHFAGYNQCYEQVLDRLVDFHNRFTTSADNYNLTSNGITKYWSV